MVFSYFFRPGIFFTAKISAAIRTPFFFGVIALLTAALAWKENNERWGGFSALLTVCTVATHTLSIVLPVALGVFVLFEFVRRRQVPFPWRAIKGYLLISVPLLLLLGLWAWFGWQNWSGKQNWGYSSIHTLMGVAFNLNWGITLTAGAGWWWAMWQSEDSSDRLWGVVVLAIVGMAIAAPMFVPFRQEYVFASTGAFFMLAARLVAHIYEQIKKQSRLVAIAIAVIFILLPLPSFISHYQDGDRHDYRSAAKFVRDHYQPEDVTLSASWTVVLRYYLPDFQILAIPDLQEGQTALASLKQLTTDKKRVWLIYTMAREELPQEVDQWLWKHGVRMLRIKKKRLDYHENVTEVYLLNGQQGQ